MDEAQRDFDASPRLFCDYRTEKPEVLDFIGGCLAIVTLPSPERAVTDESTGNEDSAAFTRFDEDTGVIILGDGMGGHASGAKASALAIASIVECVAEARRENRLPRTGIINGFELANERVQSLGTGAGTTLAVAEVGPGFMRPYHCGDSIVLVTGGRGKVKLLTTSHSPVGFGVEAGLLDQDEAMNHAERHLVLNAIGTAEMRIEIGPTVPFGGRDTLLLASDGLTDNISVREIVDAIRKGKLERSLAALTQECRRRMQGMDGRPSKPDDLTIVAFRSRQTQPRSVRPPGNPANSEPAS